MYNVVYCIIFNPSPRPRAPAAAARGSRRSGHGSRVRRRRGAAVRPRLLSLLAVGPRSRTADRVRGSGETALPQRAPRAGPAPGSYPPRVPATPVCATVEPGPRGGAPGVSRDPRPRDPASRVSR